MHHFQSRKIKSHIDAGGKVYSWWRVIVIALIGLAVLSVVILTVAFSIDTADPMTFKTYGNLKHEIHYSNDNISENEINAIADALVKIAFFDETQQKFIFIEKNTEKYIIRIPVTDGSWNDTEAIKIFIELRNSIQFFFPKNKIVLELCKNDTFDDIKKRIE